MGCVLSETRQNGRKTVDPNEPEVVPNEPDFFLCFAVTLKPHAHFQTCSPAAEKGGADVERYGSYVPVISF